ncbi:MAG: sterol desaturase family protein [Bacteriovoracaceae bacterium]|nr:sterol desaturase family protein [Bacteriovoracaceae bacterium]
MSVWVTTFIVTFCVMEFNAWFLHKYVMHGFLWVLHKDHHLPDKTRRWEYNDFFAFFFATPSFLLILSDHLWDLSTLGAIGFGIMAYGVAYFFVHEVLIHRRLKFLTGYNNWYVEAVNSAHKVHHSVKAKEGARNFGMLIVPLHYFKKALVKYKRPRARNTQEGLSN